MYLTENMRGRGQSCRDTEHTTWKVQRPSQALFKYLDAMRRASVMFLRCWRCLEILRKGRILVLKTSLPKALKDSMALGVWGKFRGSLKTDGDQPCMPDL